MTCTRRRVAGRTLLVPSAASVVPLTTTALLVAVVAVPATGMVVPPATAVLAHAVAAGRPNPAVVGVHAVAGRGVLPARFGAAVRASGVVAVAVPTVGTAAAAVAAVSVAAVSVAVAAVAVAAVAVAAVVMTTTATAGFPTPTRVFLLTVAGCVFHRRMRLPPTASRGRGGGGARLTCATARTDGAVAIACLTAADRPAKHRNAGRTLPRSVCRPQPCVRRWRVCSRARYCAGICWVCTPGWGRGVSHRRQGAQDVQNTLLQQVDVLHERCVHGSVRSRLPGRVGRHQQRLGATLDLNEQPRDAASWVFVAALRQRNGNVP